MTEPPTTPNPAPVRLLVLGCSLRKRSDDMPLPAIERYDGVAYRVLQRHLRLHPADADAQQLQVWILSAAYGLLEADTLIEWYDQRMTPTRAAELQPQVAPAALHLLSAFPPDSTDAIFVHAGAPYRHALGDTFINDPRVTYATGGMGSQLSQLKWWLAADADDGGVRSR